MSNKFALVIAINYFNTNNKLNGCINDGINIINFLKTEFKYSQENIKFLKDEGDDNHPTKNNIMNNLKEIVQKINNIDGPCEFWLSYSGHGTRVVDNNNDEISNIYDEVIVPSDYMRSGFVSDDILFSILNGITNEKCKILSLFDCCNSGTILDLRYKYINKNKKRIENKKANLVCPTYMISGCKDFQTSADYFDHEMDQYGGALTNTFLRNIKGKKEIKFINLIQIMRQQLKNNGFTQIPQLTTNKDVNDRTFMFKTNNEGIELFVQLPPPPPRRRRRRRRRPTRRQLIMRYLRRRREKIRRERRRRRRRRRR